MTVKALEKIVETAKSPMTIEEAANALPLLIEDQKKAKNILGSLLGIEKESKKEIEKLIGEIEFKINHAKSVANGNNYMILTLDPLKWRHDNGYPKLAIFSLDNPKFSITSTYDSWSGARRKDMTPKLPKEIKDCYSDVYNTLHKIGTRSTITATFSGLIPPEIKEKIKEVKGMFDQLFIIAEPEGFVKSETAIVPKGDPLLVGWKNDSKTLWLIADFDTTAVEDAMMTEGPANKQK